MLSSLKEIQNYSNTYNIPAEDVMFIDLNLSGVNYHHPYSRIRFGLKLDSDHNVFFQAKQKDILNFYLALPGNPESLYLIKNNHLFLKDDVIGTVIEPTEDFCDSSYPRRNGTVMNLNPNARTACTGCKFCYTAYQVPRDRERILSVQNLRSFIKNWIKHYQLTDLSHLIQVAVVTGCFETEEQVIDFLNIAKSTFSEFRFKGELFYFGSQLVSTHLFEKLSVLQPFAYCLSVECFERRDYFLRDKKRVIAVEQAENILHHVVNNGYRANFSYVLGLEPLEVMKENFKSFIQCINSFPIINTFQVHTHHSGLRHKTAEYFDYYLEARKIMEEIFKPTEMRPRPWENYRGLWYLQFADEFLEDIRTP